MSIVIRSKEKTLNSQCHQTGLHVLYIQKPDMITRSRFPSVLNTANICGPVVTLRVPEFERTQTHLYLLHGGQVLQLSVVDLLLQHQLLEVLSCIRLPLQRLESLKAASIRAKTVLSGFQTAFL